MIVYVLMQQLVTEVVLAVVFLVILAKYRTNLGKILLIIIFMILAASTVSLIPDMLYIYSNPIGPPPEIWSEIYYDELFARSFLCTKGLVDSFLLLILSISVGFTRWKELKNIHSKESSIDLVAATTFP